MMHLIILVTFNYISRGYTCFTLALVLIRPTAEISCDAKAVSKVLAHVLHANSSFLLF